MAGRSATDSVAAICSPIRTAREDFTPRTQAIAARLGYRCPLTAEPGLYRVDADRFALRRVPVGGRIDSSV